MTLLRRHVMSLEQKVVESEKRLKKPNLTEQKTLTIK